MSRFVFAQPYATSGLTVDRPAGFEGDRAYYVLELALLAGALLATHAPAHGPHGPGPGRDARPRAGRVGGGRTGPVPEAAGLRGGRRPGRPGRRLLDMGLRAFDPAAFDPVRGLLWFAAVVVLGADSTLGALTAAALLVGLDAGARGGVAAALIGVLAVLVGRFPGGPYEALRTATKRLRPGRAARLSAAGGRLCGGGLLRKGTQPAAVRPPPSAASPTLSFTTSPARPSRSAPFRRPAPARPWPPRPLRRLRRARRGRSRRPAGPGHRGRRAPTGPGRAPCSTVSPGPLRPTPGQVRLGGAGHHAARPPTPAPGSVIARTFQQLAVFPSLTVAENVRVGAEQGAGSRSSERRSGRCGCSGSTGPCGRRPRPACRPGTLRRVELARALAGSPRVLLLDEPAAGLDTAEVTALARVLRALAADGTALLVVEHDLDLVADLADVVHVMAAGRIVASGPAGHVLDALDRATGGGPMTLLSLRHARVRYGPLEALHGVTLTAPGPGLTVLLGRNGSGRTTVLRALAGTVPLSGGAVVWDGADVTRVPAYERARRGLSSSRSGGPSSVR